MSEFDFKKQSGMMNRILFLFFVLSFLTTGLQAQDQHFTQFYAAPLTINPALTGAFDGKFRVATIYRDQWRSVLDNPYTTYAAALDLRFQVGKYRSNQKDAAAVGILFYTDKVPGIDFITNQISISGAFHKSLNQKNTQYLSLGIQGGIAQRNLTYEEVNFSDQFNGVDNYTDLTAEILPENNFAYADFAWGLNYAMSYDNKTSLFVGIGMYHFLTPNMSFYNTESEEVAIEANPLFIRYSGQIGFQFPLAKKIFMHPRAVFALQGPHLELNAGTNFRFVLGNYSNVALHVGSWVRPVQDEQENIFLDAVVGMVGIEYNNVLFGFSFDANLGELSNSRSGQGAFEVSIAYLGEYENETVLCPKF